ncbi:MAG: hypothetical protein R3F55_09175 [Alphaproteobacteria bacterium]
MGRRAALLIGMLGRINGVAIMALPDAAIPEIAAAQVARLSLPEAERRAAMAAAPDDSHPGLYRDTACLHEVEYRPAADGRRRARSARSRGMRSAASMSTRRSPDCARRAPTWR